MKKIGTDGNSGEKEVKPKEAIWGANFYDTVLHAVLWWLVIEKYL